MPCVHIADADNRLLLMLHRWNGLSSYSSPAPSSDRTFHLDTDVSGVSQQRRTGCRRAMGSASEDQRAKRAGVGERGGALLVAPQGRGGAATAPRRIAWRVRP